MMTVRAAGAACLPRLPPGTQGAQVGATRLRPPLPQNTRRSGRWETSGPDRRVRAGMGAGA
jgi:hypothetical protein